MIASATVANCGSGVVGATSQCSRLWGLGEEDPVGLFEVDHLEQRGFGGHESLGALAEGARQLQGVDDAAGPQPDQVAGGTG